MHPFLHLQRALAMLWLTLAAPAWALNFATTFVPPIGEAQHAFTLVDDTEIKLYSTLSSGATCGNTGFSIVTGDGRTDVVRSGFAGCDPLVRSGPWALKAGSYLLKFWHNGSGGTYQVRMDTEVSTAALDTEPNDSPATALSLTPGASAQGHLGYGDGRATDGGDYYRVVLPSDGALGISLFTDPTLPTSARGYTVFAADGTSTIANTGQMTAGTYYLGLWADTYYAQAYGGYTLQTTFTPSTPTTPTTTTGTWDIRAENLGGQPRYVVLEMRFTPVPAERDATPLKLYVAGLIGSQYYFVERIDDTNYRVVPYAGGELPVYATATGTGLTTAVWTLGLFDLSGLVPPGMDIWAGFGRSAEDMVSKGQFRMVHRVQ